MEDKKYKHVPDGNDLPIAYSADTSNELVEILEYHRKAQTRLRFHWGDAKTGKDWDEVFDISGRIGLSRGTEARYPIFVHNTRSLGGGGILTDCIVKITTTKGKVLIYQHPNYHI